MLTLHLLYITDFLLYLYFCFAHFDSNTVWMSVLIVQVYNSLSADESGWVYVFLQCNWVQEQQIRLHVLLTLKLFPQ